VQGVPNIGVGRRKLQTHSRVRMLWYIWTKSRPFSYMPGRTMARIGLRMMPPFPWSSLKFRKAGVTRYGFKAGLSRGAFPPTASSSRRAVCLHPWCTSLPVPSNPRSKSRDVARWCTTMQAALRRFTPGALAPVEVALSWSIITYSAPSAPLAGTSRFHRLGLYEMPSPCVQNCGA
jgi:hypothetical protein